jgi:hypothetical protein
MGVFASRGTSGMDDTKENGSKNEEVYRVEGCSRFFHVLQGAVRDRGKGGWYGRLLGPTLDGRRLHVASWTRGNAGIRATLGASCAMAKRGEGIDACGNIGTVKDRRVKFGDQLRLAWMHNCLQ